jgi:TolB-like protein/Flp pilus assembly protein TadD
MRTGLVALAAVLFVALAAILGWRLGGGSQDASIDSVAVLPLVNDSGDASLEYLSDGVSESLINTLSNRSGLRVIARSTAFVYKGREVDPRQIGRELKVRAVFTGRLVQRGDGLSVDAELVDSRNGSRLWGEQYHRTPAELVTMQTDIARAVSHALRPAISAAEAGRIGKQYTDSADAYKLYLRGRHHLSKWSERDIKQGIECFRQAIDLDPSYALAYAGLANAFYAMSNLYLAPREAMPRSRAAAERARAIDDALPEAHYALATVKAFYDWDWPYADREFRRAMELNPGYIPLDPIYGISLMVTGQTEAARAEFERMRAMDPLSPRIAITSVNPYYFAPPAARRYDRVVAEMQALLRTDPRFVPAHTFLGMALAQEKEYDEAIGSFERARRLEDIAYILGPLGYIYGVAGRQREAREILAELRGRVGREHVAAINFAYVYLGLGEIEEMFHWLAEGLDRRDEEMTYLAVDPRFDALRADPRFVELLRQMHLVD